MFAFPRCLRAAVLSVVVCSGCATAYQTVGSYEIVDQSASLLCQRRLEFYFKVNSPSSSGERIYLGSCNMRQGVARDFHFSNSTTDRGCFGIADNGASMVYVHFPRSCDAGDKSTRKPGGVYLHSAREGDRLLYPESRIVLRWSTTPTRADQIRIGLTGCAEDFVVDANGTEKCEARRGPY